MPDSLVPAVRGCQNGPVSTYREQALIDAPVAEVWDLIGDPNRHPEWWPNVLEVDGLPMIEQDAKYRQVTKIVPGRELETTFQIEALDELHEIRLVCTDYGTKARWLLTEAQEATFTEIEITFGSDIGALGLVRAPLAKRYLRSWVQASLDGLRDAVAAAHQPAQSTVQA